MAKRTTIVKYPGTIFEFPLTLPAQKSRRYCNRAQQLRAAILDGGSNPAPPALDAYAGGDLVALSRNTALRPMIVAG